MIPEPLGCGRGQQDLVRATAHDFLELLHHPWCQRLRIPNGRDTRATGDHSSRALGTALQTPDPGVPSVAGRARSRGLVPRFSPSDPLFR